MKYRADTVFYRIGRWIWIPFTLVCIWFSNYGYGKYHQLFECSFKNMTGLPCPGCGGTRALYYLFQGKIFISFQYHPVVLYGVLAYLHFMGLYFYRSRFDPNKAAIKEIPIPVYAYIAIGVIIIQWIIKVLRILL